MATKMKKSKVPKVFLPLPDGVKIGDNIAYYLNGWRTGRLDKVDGSYAGIHVLGGAVGAHLKWVSIADIKKVD